MSKLNFDLISVYTSNDNDINIAHHRQPHEVDSVVYSIFCKFPDPKFKTSVKSNVKFYYDDEGMSGHVDETFYLLKYDNSEQFYRKYNLRNYEFYPSLHKQLYERYIEK